MTRASFLLGLALLAGPACDGGAPLPPPLAGADLDRLRQATLALEQERHGTVETLLAPLLQRPAPPARALLLAGWADYNLQRYSECVERLEAALASDPTLVADSRILGFAYYKLGAYAEAARAFRAVLATGERSSDHRTHYGLGQVLYTQGEYDAARPHLLRALELAPDYQRARLTLGRVLHALGDPAGALPLVQGVVDAEPSHADALYALSQVLAALGRTESAEAAAARWSEVYAIQERVGALDRQILAGADDPELFLAKAQLFLSIADRALAEEALRAGLGRRPGDERLAAALVALVSGDPP